MSQVLGLSVLFASHNMFGWDMHLGIWNCM